MLRYKTETRPGLVALYDIRPGNGASQFLQPRSPHGATINSIIMSGEAILSAENSGKLLGGRGSASNPNGSQSSSRPTAVGFLLQRTPLSAFGLNFRPFRPHLAVSPSLSPPVLKGLDKTLATG